MAKETLLFFLIGVFLTEISAGVSDVGSKIVSTESGPVKGYKSKHGDFYAFLGIPYATAPTGANKFKAPLPASKWTEPLEAVKENIYCPQVKRPIHWAVTTEYQEDCLVANVFVPNTNKSSLPVVVYVHGGSYQIGAGNVLRPYEFLNQVKDIIFVNFNYRLGVHGFLCLGTEDIPGNAGMKDQVAALRWIKSNIGSFGGNAENVALAGFSAGSSATDLLMLSDMTEGLFTKVILESGVSITSWSIQSEPVENAKTFATQLNFTGEDITALEDFYKATPYDLLASDSFSKRYDNSLMFVPCIERNLGQEMFLKIAPSDMLKKGKFKKLPTLIGFTNMEGILRSDLFQNWSSVMNEDFSKFLPSDLQFENEQEKHVVANTIRRYYFGDKDVNNETIKAFFTYLGDSMFRYPTLINVRSQIKAGNEKIYLYQYSYIDNEIASSYLYPEVKGADHCAQTYALLESFTLFPISDSYNKMKSITRRLWANFIKTGNPVPEVTSDFPGGWLANSAPDSPYMELTLPPQLKHTPLPDVVQFWDAIYNKYYRKPLPPPATPQNQFDL